MLILQHYPLLLYPALHDFRLPHIYIVLETFSFNEVLATRQVTMSSVEQLDYEHSYNSSGVTSIFKMFIATPGVYEKWFNTREGLHGFPRTQPKQRCNRV